MPYGTWWRGEPLPDLPPLANFSARVVNDVPLLVRLVNVPAREIEARFQSENRAYIAFLDAIPTAYGWVGSRSGRISALHFSFTIPARNLYLWDFQTLPPWRGRGLYPRLLQAIIQQEQTYERFWIGYAPGNEVSSRGIQKAGFDIVGDFMMIDGRVAGLELYHEGKHGQASADFYHLPILAGS